MKTPKVKIKTTVSGKITATDLKNANNDYKKKGEITTSCLVFQAAKRLGLKPTACYNDSIECRRGVMYHIDKSGKVITGTNRKNWSKRVGRKFTLSMTLKK